MAQVLMPQHQKDDALTTIMKGLNVANQVYGLKTNMAQLDEYQKKADENDALKARREQNIYTKPELLELGTKYNISSTKPAGESIEIKDESGSPLHLSMLKQKSPLLEKIPTMQNGKPGTLVKDFNSGQETFYESYQKPEGGPKEPKLTPVETIDANGNPIMQVVQLKEGQTFRKPGKVDAASEKNQKELDYRYVSLKNNAAKLKDLVQENGTMALTGPKGAEMDSIIYQMAVDYAKMVDPASVAREGEVSAAQKYMLPFRQGILDQALTKNSTALKMIDNYSQSLDERLAANQAAQKGDRNALTYKPKDMSGSSEGTAFAATPASMGSKQIMPAPQDKVMVINKEGKPGLIPKANLQKALDQGYTEVK